MAQPQEKNTHKYMCLHAGDFLQLLQAAPPPSSPAARTVPDLAAGFCRLGGRAVCVLAAPSLLFSCVAYPAPTRAQA